MRLSVDQQHKFCEKYDRLINLHFSMFTNDICRSRNFPYINMQTDDDYSNTLLNEQQIKEAINELLRLKQQMQIWMLVPETFAKIRENTKFSKLTAQRKTTWQRTFQHEIILINDFVKEYQSLI